MKKAAKNLFTILLGSTLVGSFIDPLADRAQGLVGNAIRQVRETSTGLVRQVIEMLVVACLGLVGVVFILMGLALFLESQVAVPGSGLGYVGAGVLFFSLVTLLVMKYHKSNK